MYVICDETLLFACNTFNRCNFDMILLEILSQYTSNSGYFIHHVIGQIIFYLPSLMIDIYRINKNEENLNFNWKHLLIIFFDSLIENILITYKKYLMEIKFIQPFIVCFLFGSVNLVYILILFSFTLINRNVICFEQKCFNIFNFDINNKNTFFLVFIIFSSIIIDCIFFFSYFHILDLFTTSHTLFNFSINVMLLSIKTAIDNDLNLRGWLLISLACIFIFIGIFIYLEIIELNFCNLNENTRIRIAERAKETKIERLFSEEFLEIELTKNDEEKTEEKKEEKKIEIAPGYFIYI